MSTIAIHLDAVSKVYGRVTALDGLSLSIMDGEVVGLLGHNGAGKSTTMKLLLGLVAPSRGRIEVFGKSPTSDDALALRYGLGYLPENVSFYDTLSGREVLQYFARLKRFGSHHCDDLLQRVGLKDVAHRRVKTYSKGMRQRLGLAQALLGHPKLLLLDEPTVGLDPVATQEFYEVLDELRNLGTTIILSSHVLAGIERHIDRAIILRRGRLQAAGSLNELRRRAQLPLAIHVRGDWPEDQWHAVEPIMRVERRGTGQVTLFGRLEDKVELTRRVLAHPGVEDFEVWEPSLEALYAHFGVDDRQEGRQ